MEKVPNDNLSLRYFVGSGGIDHRSSPSGSAHVPIHRFVAYLSLPEFVGTVDVMEFFGGGGGAGKFCVRRRLTREANFDLVTGFDFTKEGHQREVLRYMSAHKPLGIIIRGPRVYPSAIGHT